MTDDIDALLARLDKAHLKATPGDWFVNHPDDDMCMTAVTINVRDSADLEDYMHNIAITLLQTPQYAAEPRWEENAEWIAASHNAYPRLRAALVEARERVAEYEEDYRQVIADEFAGDEEHCSCVPHLRRRIAELEAQRDEVVASLNFLTTGQYSQHADYTNHKLQAALTALSHLYEACYAADVTDEPERITGEVLDEAKHVLGLLVEEE